MLVTTDAIVLRSRKQGDTSKICALYTKEYGLVDVIAKGAREMKSKFAGALELYMHITAVFYKKQGKELYLLAKSENVSRMSGIGNSLAKIESATKIAELLLNTLHDEEKNPTLFTLLSATYEAISAAATDEHARSLLYSFYSAFAKLGGFELHIPADIPHGKFPVFEIEKGCVLMMDSPMTSESRFYIPISPEVCSILRFYQNAEDPTKVNLKVTENAGFMLERLFAAYFAAHIESAHHTKSKSARVFASM